MFNLFKKKDKKHFIKSIVKGKTVPLSQVSDETFSSEMLGKGVAFIPYDDTFVSPVNGEVAMVFETLHAISIISENGEEIMLHVGLDTVQLKGEGFLAYVKAGDRVKVGDKLLKADINFIKNKGYDTTSILLICNTDSFSDIKAITDIDVDYDSDVLEIIK